jgi:hypothetical protein
VTRATDRLRAALDGSWQPADVLSGRARLAIQDTREALKRWREDGRIEARKQDGIWVYRAASGEGTCARFESASVHHVSAGRRVPPQPEEPEQGLASLRRCEHTATR